MSRESLKVCFVSLSAYGYFKQGAPFGGGAQRQLYLLSQELKDRFEVSFVVGNYGQPSVERRDGVTLYRAYKPDHQASFLTELGSLGKLLAAMRRADADIYICRDKPKKAAILYSLTRLLRSKWVFNIANDANLGRPSDSLPSPIRWIYNRAISEADTVIAQTDYQKSIVRSKYNGTATVVPNGYPPAQEHVPYDEREAMIWVGRLDRDQKRPHIFLDLAEKHPDAEFRLIGGSIDPQTDYSAQVCDRAQSMDNVTYVGRVAPDAIHEEYRSAKALINTSVYEGFPNTFLEAWRYGTPVLSLDIDTGRYLGDEAIGYAQGDFDCLCSKMKEIANNPNRRRQFGKVSQEYFNDNYQISHVAQKYEEAIKSA